MANIDVLAPIILQWEGGFVNDPIDQGGATKMGVTIATWKAVGYDKDGDGDIDVDDLKMLTREDVINRVLKPHYWDRWQADLIDNQSIANLLVDFVWASGKHGIVIPQRIMGLEPDGIVGKQTLNKVNTLAQKKLFNALHDARRQFILDIVRRSVDKYEKRIGRKATRDQLLRYTQMRFLSGWIRRLESFKYSENAN